MSTPSSQSNGDNKTALVISNFFNERYANIQSLSQKIKAESRKRRLGQPLATATAYSKRRRSRSYCRYHQYHSRPAVCVSKRISFSSSSSPPVVAMPLKESRKRSTYRHLVTHKWHAKRFHMVKQWGFVLPRAHMHRGRQFLWSALKTQCLIHDQSYLVPVVLLLRGRAGACPLQAETGGLMSMLARLMDPLQAEACIHSFREQRHNTLHEQQICLYRTDCFPQQCLGPATVFLTPTATAGEQQQRQLWLWVHPAMLKEVEVALRQATSHLTGSGSGSGAGVAALNAGMDIDIIDMPSPRAGDSSGASGRFSRISVIGTGASQLLTRVIKPLLTSKRNVENGIFFNQVLQSEGINALWKHNEGLSFEALDCRELVFKEKGRTEIRVENPYRTWTSLSSAAPTSLSTASTAAAASPSTSRQRAQKKKNKRLVPPASPVSSAFFAGLQADNGSVRGQGKEARKVGDAVLNVMRQQQRQEAYQFCGGGTGIGSQQHRVVTKDAKGSDEWSFVPQPATSRATEQEQHDHCDEQDEGEGVRSNLKFQILLIRKCRSADNTKDDTDTGLLPLCLRGWDLIVPEQHCPDVWLALHYAGGRSIGLEERAVLDGAMVGPSFPRDFPDSSAGREHWKRWRTQNHMQNKRRPVRKRKENKRLERVPNLKSLFEDGCGDGNDNGSGSRGSSSSLSSMTDLVVMRNVEFARPFFPNQLLQPIQHARAGHISASTLKCRAAYDLDTCVEGGTGVNIIVPEFPFPTLIRVYLWATGRGVPQSGAQLFQPSRGDYELWLEHRSHRSEATTTENRKWGDWNGDASSTTAAPAAGEGRCGGGGRVLVGVVSSALQPDLFRPEKGATAFCEAGKLSQMVALSSSIIKGGGKRSEVVPLIMYRNPLGDIVRPALFQLCLN